MKQVKEKDRQKQILKELLIQVLKNVIHQNNQEYNQVLVTM